MAAVALWHSLCNMRIVSDRSFHAKAYAYPCFPSMTVCRRHAPSLLLSNAAHQRIPRSITSSVSSKLSRSDFVQLPKVGKEFLKDRRDSDTV